VTRHVVMFSGGIGSWAAAKRVADRHGTDGLVLLFTDVKGASTDPHIGEDEDTYRFLHDASANVGAELVILNEGRDIWQVFAARKFLGNSRQANCSTELKQKPAAAWVAEHCDETTTIHIGIDWTEQHRLPAVVKSYAPLTVSAPLCEPPYLTKAEMLEWASAEGLEPPRLYGLGFAHNNCGGGCVRAGQAQFAHLLRVMPERFAVWQANEERMQAVLGRPVTILKESRNGVAVSLPLAEVRRRVESQPSLLDMADIGGCGCFVQDEVLA
jgi:hypothetical protein